MQELLDVYIGTASPEQWSRREKRPELPNAPRKPRLRIAAEEIDWQGLGLMPRWAGGDPSNAVAAIEASDHKDWGRFHSGTEMRREATLYISTTRPAGHGSGVTRFKSRPVIANLGFEDEFWVFSDSIRLARPPALAEDLSATHRDLALRIRNISDAEWTELEIASFDGKPVSSRKWNPLLVTPDGLTVAGYWYFPEAGDFAPIYHYVLPTLPSYRPILQWLVERAVPDLIPSAAARTRRYVAEQPELQSIREREITEQIASLAARAEKEMAALQQQLARERADVKVVRDPLLFGTGRQLEEAVRRVLVDAGVTTTLLDPELGTRSGDLLAEYSGRRILIEVKSAGGNAPESLVEAPLRHQRTWPHLRPDLPLDAVALVVSHQHRRPPADRSPTVYRRREFVDSLEIPVISAVQLFDAWRQGECARVRAAFGLEPVRVHSTRDA